MRNKQNKMLKILGIQRILRQKNEESANWKAWKRIGKRSDEKIKMRRETFRFSNDGLITENLLINIYRIESDWSL